MSKIKTFNKGDVILTQPEEGFWGIAVVLSEREKTETTFPMCHIALTKIMAKHRINFSDLTIEDLKPLVFERIYDLKNKAEFTKTETCIGVYTRKNKANFEIIGNINPALIYDGPLPFAPTSDLEIKFAVYGDAHKTLGREAYLDFIKRNP